MSNPFAVARKYLLAETRLAAKRDEVTPNTATADDPILAPEQWYPFFREFHHHVVRKSANFDYAELQAHNLNLYLNIKTKEGEIDALGAARLSEVMAIMREWRELILKAEIEQIRGNQ